MFHFPCKRELEAAFRIKQNYDFTKFSGIWEINLYGSEETIKFKENAILLFKLEDATFLYWITNGKI